MRRHIIQDNFNRHRGQKYGHSAGRSYESERDAQRGISRDRNRNWSSEDDWNNDLNMVTGENSVMAPWRDFRGKGPKGHILSDEKIKENASEALLRSYDVDASEIELTVEEGIVYLKGIVESREMKWDAEDCVSEVYGVRDVHNELKSRRKVEMKRESSTPENQIGTPLV